MYLNFSRAHCACENFWLRARFSTFRASILKNVRRLLNALHANARKIFFENAGFCTINFWSFSRLGFNSKNAISCSDWAFKIQNFLSSLEHTYHVLKFFAKFLASCTFLHVSCVDFEKRASTFERVHVSCKGSREKKKVWLWPFEPQWLVFIATVSLESR